MGDAGCLEARFGVCTRRLFQPLKLSWSTRQSRKHPPHASCFQVLMSILASSSAYADSVGVGRGARSVRSTYRLVLNIIHQICEVDGRVRV